MNEQEKHTHKVNKKPKKTTGLIVAVCISVFVLLVVIVGILWFVENQSEENPFRIDGIEYSTNESGDKFIIMTNEKGEQSAVIIDPDNVDINDIKELIQKKSHYNVLVVGKDRLNFNTDVFMLASYDVESGAVSIMQIPRDTYIKLFDEKGKTRGNKKVNSILCDFFYDVYSGDHKKTMAEALGLLKKEMSRVLGIPIHYYVYMDLNGFVDIVDAIGGVTMDVPSRMYYSDPEQNLYINLYPGVQTLNGDKAEQFIRFRKGYANADLGRVDAQKLFMKAFVKNVIEKFNVNTISTITQEISENVITDVSVNDMIYFAKSALSIDPEKINMFTVPGDLAGAYYVISRSETYKCMNDYFNPYTTALKESGFDSEGNFYDTVGSRIYAVYSGDKNVVVYTGEDNIKLPVVQPVLTTAASEVDTTVPEESGNVHTSMPDETIGEPAETTGEPIETTGELAETTAEPVETTGEPIETTEAPAETTEALVEITDPPEETTEELVETTEAPAETSETPAETTEAAAA